MWLATTGVGTTSWFDGIRAAPAMMGKRHSQSFEEYGMPWTSSDAERHTHKATTPELKDLWAKVANESLERDGDEGRAIREANAVVARQA